MKKLLLLLTLLTTITNATNAQTKKAHYQGEAQIGYSIGIGITPNNRANIHLLNGIRFNKYLFTGVGTGLDIYSIDSETLLAIPIFFNLKGYMPVSNTTSMFLSLDLGTAIGTDEIKEVNFFSMTPGIGASFNVAEAKAITINLGYCYQALGYYYTGDGGSAYRGRDNTGAITFKVGFSF